MALDISNDIEISNISASVSDGGWKTVFRVVNDSDLLELYHNVVVHWQGAHGGDFGAPLLAFNGYVVPQRVTIAGTGSSTEQVASTSHGILRTGWLQGLGLADTDADPRDHYHQWDSVTGGGNAERMTLGRIVRHILGFYDELGVPPATNPDWIAHTNLVYHAVHNPHGWISLDEVEVEPFDAVANPDGTMRLDLLVVRESNNLWTTLQSLARTEFFEIYFDKSDTLHYTRHPMYRDVLPDPVMTFDKSFCSRPPVVQFRDAQQLRQARFAAFMDDGDTLHSNFPVTPTHVYGNAPIISNLRCNDQDTLDSWAARYYYFTNRPWTVTWVAPGACGLRFELLDRVQITYTGTLANGVHIDWNEEKFWIHSISVDPIKGGSATTTYVLEAESIPPAYL